MNTILVVEDNEKNLKLFAEILTASGYNILAARDGAEGIRLAKENSPALILMDIQMPVMDGKKAMQILKAEPATKAIPIIAITSYAMPGDMERMLGDGFDAYMAKPIDFKEFCKIIEKTLDKAVKT